MNPKSVLVKCISLLFRETQLTDKSDSKDLVKEVVGCLKINSANAVNTGEILLEELKNICMNMVERTVDMPYLELMQHLKIACATDNNTLESIQDAISFELPETELQKIILSYRFDLNKWVKRKRTIDKIEKLAYDIKFNSEKIDDLDDYISSNVVQIQDDLMKSDEGDIPGLVTRFKLSDKETLAEQFEVIKQESDGSRTIKMPWQAMNRMTQGGLRLGELVTVAGLPHNGKSYVTRSMFAGGCYYTDPNELLRDKSKKPMCVIFTLEDKAPVVISELYVLLKGNLDNDKIDINRKREMNSESAADYVYNALSRTGYEIEFIQANPDEMNYRDIQNAILSLESQGYEIHMCLIDYLNLVGKRGLSNTRSDLDIQELFRRTKNFMLSRDICVVTPHQLSSDAMEIKRQGKKDLVKLISTGSYYDGCRTLSKEPELEIFIDKVIDNSIAHICFARGKHRGVNDTPEEDKYFILPFAPVGGLKWDIEGNDTSMTRFGATRNANGQEELALWDMGM